jgi:osmotically-inducible protein OsmY
VKPRTDRHIRSLAVGCLIAFGLAGYAAAGGARAQAEPPNMSAAVQTTADLDLAEKVQVALQSDPYINNTHIEVSVENGTIYLRGFVMGAWDLLDAIRIAHRAGGGNRVIDELSIIVGGRK